MDSNKDLPDILKGIFERALRNSPPFQRYDLVLDKTTRPNTFDLLKDIPIEELSVKMKPPFSFCGWRKEGNNIIFTIEDLDWQPSVALRINLIP